jgi:hypothetical protein
MPVGHAQKLRFPLVANGSIAGIFPARFLSDVGIVDLRDGIGPAYDAVDLTFATLPDPLSEI